MATEDPLRAPAVAAHTANRRVLVLAARREDEREHRRNGTVWGCEEAVGTVAWGVLALGLLRASALNDRHGRLALARRAWLAWAVSCVRRGLLAAVMGLVRGSEHPPRGGQGAWDRRQRAHHHPRCPERSDALVLLTARRSTCSFDTSLSLPTTRGAPRHARRKLIPGGFQPERHLVGRTGGATETALEPA